MRVGSRKVSVSTSEHVRIEGLDIAAGEYAPHDAYGTEDQGLQLRNVDLIVGDTPQILFVKSGVMYDIVTMEGDEAWLVDILPTWQFE